MKTSTAVLLVLPMGGLAVPIMKYPRNPGAWDNFKGTVSKIPAAFGQVPNALASGGEKAFSKENGNAFGKSAGSVGPALAQVPGAVKKGVQSAVSPENGKALKKSAGSVGPALAQVPGAVKKGVQSAVSPENGKALKKSAGSVGPALAQVPGAVKKGVQSAFSQENLDAFKKSAGDLSQQYDKYLPPGSNGRKVFDGVTGSLPPLGSLGALAKGSKVTGLVKALGQEKATSNPGKIAGVALDGLAAAKTTGQQVYKTREQAKKNGN